MCCALESKGPETQYSSSSTQWKTKQNKQTKNTPRFLIYSYILATLGSEFKEPDFQRENASTTGHWRPTEIHYNLHFGTLDFMKSDHIQ